MVDPRTTENPRQDDRSSNGTLADVPKLGLPKGGGAIHGIGEKFAANPVTGTGSVTIPIAASPGRSGFSPSLSLGYDSGAANNSFGFGWSVKLAMVTRKTDKGLPQYNDDENSDIFLLSDAEDLIPALIESKNGWAFNITLRSLYGAEYSVQRYRPRVEGLFAPHRALEKCRRRHRRFLEIDLKGQHHHLVRPERHQPYCRPGRPHAASSAG